MKYTLPDLTKEKSQKKGLVSAFQKMYPLLAPEKKAFSFALVAVLINSVLTLSVPLLMAYTIDVYIVPKQFSGVLLFGGIILLIYCGAFITSYIQTRVMGSLGQRTLFALRNQIFNKLQELPIAFFNQNKVGDLISRINNDTDKLNQFFAQSLVQLSGSIFILLGAMAVMLAVNLPLGIVALAPALFLIFFTRAISPWVKKTNIANLQALGGMSAEVQEGLENFKVVAAFNRRDYFRERFSTVNKENFNRAFFAGVANTIFSPAYTFFSNAAQLGVLSYGIYLIIQGNLTIGLLISFLAYVNQFYTPLQQVADTYSTMQTALAAWDRISQILNLESNLPILETEEKEEIKPNVALEFKNVSFHYDDGVDVLHDISFALERGKTYAFVGPTGGGKTTTASLMARLYDATSGQIFLEGRDIRSFNHNERTKKIGFILQDPYIFSGTLKDNILYGNEEYAHLGIAELSNILKKDGLEDLLGRFEKGLDTDITSTGNMLSLGQKQLIAFLRTVLRKPDLLILDEATANIDTVTELLLSNILEKLPKKTTQVVIAHRLNTIKNADQIYFINTGTVTLAGSFDHALEMLLADNRKS